MPSLRVARLSLVLASCSGLLGCGGEDAPPGSGSSGAPAPEPDGGPVAKADASVPADPDSGSPDASADAGPELAHGFLYAKGTVDALVVRFFDPTDGLGAADASPPVDEDWWGGVLPTHTGDHFMYGDQDGRILVGHARRGGAAADATGVPLRGGPGGRQNATLLDDGTLIYAGEYFEAGIVDVFRGAERVSTGPGRLDIDDLGFGSTTVYGAGASVAWSFADDEPIGVYARWGGAPGAELHVEGAGDVDAVSPAEDCLTFLPADNAITTKIACRGEPTADLGAEVGSLAATWHASAGRFVGFRPFGGPSSAYVVERQAGAWSALSLGAATDATLSGTSQNADGVAFRSNESPLSLLDLSQDRDDYAAAVSAPLWPEGFDPFAAVFSPEGERAVVLSHQAAYLVTVGSTAAMPITFDDGPEGFCGAAWSPDGAKIVFGRCGPEGAVAAVLDPATQNKTPIPVANVAAVRWASVDRLAIVDLEGDLRVVGADGSGAEAAPVDSGVVWLFASIDTRP